MGKRATKGKALEGMSNTEKLRRWFDRHARKRNRAEPAKRAAREAEADARHDRKISRRETTIALGNRRLQRIEDSPTVLGVRQLAEMLEDRTLPDRLRVRAATLILRLGDDIPPGGPHEGPPHGIPPR